VTVKLGSTAANGAVLFGLAWFVAAACLQEHAEPLVRAAQDDTRAMAALEQQAALEPTAESVGKLASAYLDRNQPGLATAVLEQAGTQLLDEPNVARLYARALFHRGRAREALAVARRASGACTDAPDACAGWLVAATSRQVAFLEQLAQAGIEDPLTDPAATLAAARRSRREATLVAMW
jgi:hypothetical protein